MAYESKYENPSTLKMDYIHTEAHQMAYDLSVYLHKKVREMPHYEKFTLQKDIRECIDGIMDEIEAYERSKTISHLYTADRLKGRLVRKIRLAHDLKYSAMNDRVYKYCASYVIVDRLCEATTQLLEIIKKQEEIIEQCRISDELHKELDDMKNDVDQKMDLIEYDLRSYRREREE